jgi:hypothetical protein
MSIEELNAEWEKIKEKHKNDDKNRRWIRRLFYL